MQGFISGKSSLPHYLNRSFGHRAADSKLPEEGLEGGSQVIPSDQCHVLGSSQKLLGKPATRQRLDTAIFSCWSVDDMLNLI